MLDFSFGELLLIVLVAVVCIGPKELPVVVRAIAKGLAHMRALSRELKAAFDDLARESGLKETQDEIEREMKTITGDDGKSYPAYKIDDFIQAKDGKPRSPAAASAEVPDRQINRPPEQR